MVEGTVLTPARYEAKAQAQELTFLEGALSQKIVVALKSTVVLRMIIPSRNS